MKLLKLAVLLFFMAVFILPLAFNDPVKSQTISATDVGSTPDVSGPPPPTGPTEAPVGFDNQTNGLVNQPEFNRAQGVFEDVEVIANGLGPVYNAQSCRECHQNPVTGAISQITELRAGHLDSAGNFVSATVTLQDEQGNPVIVANRSLINDRAICPNAQFPNSQAQERIPESGEPIRTFRTSLNTLGDGFVEAILDTTLVNIRNSQPAGMQGQVIVVPVAENPGATRVGRFGWKNQVPSLLTFSGDAYLNEMGITNRLFPAEITTLCDTVADPEDTKNDIDGFAEFMRATKAPSRNGLLANTANAQAGSVLFGQIGCAICHVTTIVTAPVGTVINGGTFTVPAALGNKVIHPFGDFLLHDVGTGDGILQNGPPETRNKMRTVPLWGVRTRDRLMHDGESLTFTQAILRHQGEAIAVTNAFIGLTDAQKGQLITFLKSL